MRHHSPQSEWIGSRSFPLPKTMTPSSLSLTTIGQKPSFLFLVQSKWGQKIWQNYISAMSSLSSDSPQKLSQTEIPVLPPSSLGKFANRLGSNRTSAPCTTLKLMVKQKEQTKTWKPTCEYSVINNKMIGQRGYLSHNSLSIADHRIL